MIRDARSNDFYAYLFAALVFVAAYVFSGWILEYYTGGDQKYYILLYDALRWSQFSHISDMQLKYTGSTEPLYGLLMWVLSPSFEKNMVMSFSNAILMSSLFLVLRKYGANILFTILIFTNYYILVLLTSAERLKFAYIFGIIAVLVPVIWRAAAIIASLLSHYSILIVIISIAVPPKYRELLSYLQGKSGGSVKKFLLFIGAFSSFILFITLYREQITDKIWSYESYDVTDMLQGLVLFVVAMIVTNDRANMAIALSFPLVATFILGGERVNMLTVSVFIYLILREGKTKHPIVLLLLAYLSYKSWDYMQNVLAYGTGYLV